MALFKKKGDCPPAAPTASDTPRGELAKAIAAVAQCEAAVKELEAAEEAGFTRRCEAMRRLEALKESHERQDDGAADAFLASMRAGGDGAVMDLDAPAGVGAHEVEAMEREIATLARVRAEIAERVPGARQRADDAKRKVADLAKEMLASTLDPDALIAEGEQAFQRLSDAMARIRFACSLLPYQHPDAERLRLWPETHFRNVGKHDDYRLDPANSDLVAAFEALMRGDVSAIDLAP